MQRSPRHDPATLEIRPIAPEDKPALQQGLESLSAESRYRRFLSPHGRLTEAELRYLTEIDHHDHEALVALDPDAGAGVGVARYVRSPDDPESAELAVAVVDEWQGHGVGSRLAAELAQRARAEGIRRFSALVLAGNEEMVTLLEDIGRTRVLSREHGTVELSVELPATGLGRLKTLLAAAARGQIIPTSLRTWPLRS